jgi:subtilisin family serine protease
MKDGIGKREYAILKLTNRTPAASFGRSSRAARSRPEQKLDVAIKALDQNEVREIARDPNSLTAPAMPLRLIEPTSRATLEDIQTEPPWGLEAIGVTTCKFNGEGIVVAVLDTGIDRTHEAFSHIPAKRLKERDFTEDGDGDVDGHGTHCAGTIFGSTVKGVRIGIAPNVDRVLIGKVLGKEGASSTTLLSAIRWALESGANVVSMSLGMDFPGYAQELIDDDYPADLATSIALDAYRQNTKLFDALGELVRAGSAFLQPAIIVAAAGNASRRDIDPRHSISVEPPAVCDGILSVGAVGRDGKKLRVAAFSNSGPDIVAPGVDIVSARAGGGVTLMSGTSMATPHVAGAAVLWAEYFGRKKRRLTGEILKSKLTGTALPLDDLEQVDVGTGLVRVPSDD